MKFHDPLLLLLALVVLPLLFLLRGKRPASGIRFSHGELLQGIQDTFRVNCLKNMIYLRSLAVVLMVVAISRPQSTGEETKIIKEGIDIVLTVDVSTSMLAEDFSAPGTRKNRLEAAKDVIKEFTRARESDRIGMVVFGSRSYPLCPLTLDHEWLRNNLARLEIGMVEDGTAIGSGLLAALNGLKKSDAKSKIIILLTDGRNNAGDIPVETAAAAAKALNVKIYTVGVGSRGSAYYPVRDPFGKRVFKKTDVDLDEGTLQMVAAKSGGRYFRATDIESFRDTTRTIDRLEKTKIEEKVTYHYRELFPLFLLPALCLFFLEVLLNNTLLRTTPS